MLEISTCGFGKWSSGFGLVRNWEVWVFSSALWCALVLLVLCSAYGFKLWGQEAVELKFGFPMQMLCGRCSGHRVAGNQCWQLLLW